MLTAINNLEICADDISTTFPYGKARGNVYIIDPKNPDHPQFVITDYDHWQESYSYVKEMIPEPKERQEATGPKVSFTVYKCPHQLNPAFTRTSHRNQQLRKALC